MRALQLKTEKFRHDLLIPQRPVAAVRTSFDVHSDSSLFSWQRKTSNHPVRWHRVAGVASPDTVQCWQVSHPVLAVHECQQV